MKTFLLQSTVLLALVAWQSVSFAQGSILSKCLVAFGRVFGSPILKPSEYQWSILSPRAFAGYGDYLQFLESQVQKPAYRSVRGIIIDAFRWYESRVEIADSLEALPCHIRTLSFVEFHYLVNGALVDFVFEDPRVRNALSKLLRRTQSPRFPADTAELIDALLAYVPGDPNPNHRAAFLNEVRSYFLRSP